MNPDEKVIYLDNAATTFPKPEVVYQAMDEFYRNYGGNAGRGANPLARKAASLVEETRGLLREWLDAQEVVFAPSATIALNTVIQGARLRPGDVVYVTPFEHNSVLRPLEHIRQKNRIEIRLIPFDPSTFECDLESAAELFRIDPPTMVCATLISNVFGNILPIDDIFEAARSCNPNCVSIVDAAQGAGLHSIEMPHANALIFSGHKSLYGPFGISGIAFGTEWRPDPLIFGGTGTVSQSIAMPDHGPSRFEAGSHNALAIAGLNAATRWLDGSGRKRVGQVVESHTRDLILALEDIAILQMYPKSMPFPLSGIVSFTLDGISPQSIEAALGANGVAVRSGLHCAPWAHEWAGTLSTGGTTRIGLGYFNTNAELHELSNVLHDICNARRAKALS